MSFSKEWHALGREAELASEQIANGIAALSRANHAQKGLYTQALFGLSIGIERFAKLVIVADYAITNSGKFPTNDTLKKFGHNVGELLDHCSPIIEKYRSGKIHSSRPSSAIHTGIVQTLTEFGKGSRYYNLDYLVGSRAAQSLEPVSAWWQRVGEPILSKHYGAKQRKRDAAALVSTGKMDVMVISHTEGGDPIDNIEQLMLLGYATRVVQTYGRLYTLQIVRWLAFLITDFATIGQANGIEPLIGLDERVMPFRAEDEVFRTRKRWSIYQT